METNTSEIESGYKSIVENSPDIIVRYDKEFRHLFVNREGLKKIGISREKILGKSIREFTLFDTRNYILWEENLSYVFKTSNSLEYKAEWKHSDSTTWLDCRLSPEFSIEGDVTSVIAVYRDITKQELTEKSKNETEEIFRFFMQNSPIYVFFKDAEIRSLKLSKNYEKMLGMPMEELIGKTMDELFPSDFAKKIVADDIRILNSRDVVFLEEEFNGRYYTTIKFPIVIEGKPKYLAGYTIDITEQKIAEKALAEKVVELERFNSLMLGREKRMIELKKEINELLINTGKKEKYKIPK